jgi:hypothetical protein
MSETAEVQGSPVSAEAPAAKDAPVTPEVPSQKAPDDMSSKFAALAKKERFIRMNAQNIKAKEMAIAQREKQIAERERAWESEWKSSPLEALKRRNVTYQDLTNAALNDGKFAPEAEIKSVKEEIEQLRQEQADRERPALQQRQQMALAAEQQAIDGFKNKIAGAIESNKDKFELTHLYDAQDLVFQTVEEHFLRTQRMGNPKILSVDEACELVEQYLEAEVERTATSSKKFQSKYSAIKAKEAEQKQGSRSTTTLSNSLNSSAAPTLLSAATEDDRMKRALAALS